MKCKVCKSNKIVDLFYSTNMHGKQIINNKEKFIVSRCGDCGVVFLKDINVNSNYYKKYYELGYYTQQGIKRDSLLDTFLKYLSRLSARRKQRWILDVLNDKDDQISILDIGCGNGNFLSALDSLKFDTYGVEINKQGYEMSRKKGLKVYHGDIKNIDFGKKKFDVISLWHVFEHIEDPNGLFNIINKILVEDGVLIFQIPNLDSFGFKIGRKYWFHLDSPRHLILYGEKGVKKLCERHKFKIVSIKDEPYEYPLDLFWSLRKSYFRFLCYPIYPVVKLISRETLTYICKKSDFFPYG